MLHIAPVTLPNVLGVLALFTYIVTLLPTNLRVVFPSSRRTKIPTQLLKYRRWIGILAFLIALAHAYLLVIKRSYDFLDLKTYFIYFPGLASFLILIILTVTSNQWSVKKLKKNWKRLHQLTYWAMFLLCWHIFATMLGHGTYLTFLGIFGITLIILLYLRRRWIEEEKQKVKEQKLQA